MTTCCDRDAIRFCFGNLISRELEEFMVTWNHHRIRQSNMAETPGGIPDILYHIPEESGIKHHCVAAIGYANSHVM